MGKAPCAYQKLSKVQSIKLVIMTKDKGYVERMTIQSERKKGHSRVSTKEQEKGRTYGKWEQFSLYLAHSFPVFINVSPT